MTHSSNEPTPELDLSAITRGWKTLAVTTLGAMAVGATLLFSITPQQEVNARLIVEKRELSPAGITTVIRDREFLPTQAEILASPAVVSGAVGMRSGNNEMEPVGANVAAVISNLKVDPLTGTGVLLLKYTDPDADVAAAIVESLVLSYTNYVTESEHEQNRELVAALNLRSTQIKDRMDRLQQEYVELKHSSSESVTADSATSSRIIASLESEIAAIEHQRAALERAADRLNSRDGNIQLSAVEFVPRGSVPESVESAKNTIAILKDLLALYPDQSAALPDPAPVEDRYRMAQDQVNATGLRFGPQHPEMRAAQAALETAEKAMIEFAIAVPATVQESLSTVAAREQAMHQRYENHVEAAGQQQVAMMQESQKMDELEQAREAFQVVQAQLEHLQILERAVEKGQAGIFVSVLEHPTPAPRSFVTNPAVVVGIVGLVGLISGVLLLLSLPTLRKLQGTPAELLVTGA